MSKQLQSRQIDLTIDEKTVKYIEEQKINATKQSLEEQLKQF